MLTGPFLPLAFCFTWQAVPGPVLFFATYYWQFQFMTLQPTPTNFTSIKSGHYPRHFSEFSGFSKMKFYTTTHSITTNVIDLVSSCQDASNSTPMSTLKMKLQGIMTLQAYLKKFRSKMVNLLMHYNLSASSRTSSEKQLLHRYTPGVHLQYVLISRGHREHLCCGYLDLELTNQPSLNFLLGG